MVITLPVKNEQADVSRSVGGLVVDGEGSVLMAAGEGSLSGGSIASFGFLTLCDWSTVGCLRFLSCWCWRGVLELEDVNFEAGVCLVYSSFQVIQWFRGPGFAICWGDLHSGLASQVHVAV